MHSTNYEEERVDSTKYMADLKISKMKNSHSVLQSGINEEPYFSPEIANKPK